MALRGVYKITDSLDDPVYLLSTLGFLKMARSCNQQPRPTLAWSTNSRFVVQSKAQQQWKENLNTFDQELFSISENDTLLCTFDIDVNILRHG